MNTILPTLIIAVLTASPLFAKPKTANDFFQQGEAALKTGDLATARASYRQALELQPDHGNAKYRLLSLKDMVADSKAKLRKKRLESIILPQIAFDNITFKEAIDDLGTLIEQASADTFVPNFVIEDPTGKFTNTQIKLRLKNIPANVALRYVASQGKAKASISEHVITLRPLGTSPQTSTPANPQTSRPVKLSPPSDPFAE